mgnify:CR=1 FL=1
MVGAGRTELLRLILERTKKKAANASYMENVSIYAGVKMLMTWVWLGLQKTEKGRTYPKI